MVIAIIAILVAMLLAGLKRAKDTAQKIRCTGNLRQWALAMHLYTGDNDDYMPYEGTGNLLQQETGWYVVLPRLVKSPDYWQMPWHTNPAAPLNPCLFICPSNTNRSNGINLFHYCLNEHLDDTGTKDHPVKLTSLRPPSNLVWLFDNGKKAARAQQNNVHTNVHTKGANISFVDGHVSHHRSVSYWDYKLDKGRTNNPEMVWIPVR